MNPEFVRNLWLEISLTRLAATAIALAAVFGLSFQLTDDWKSIATIARSVFVVIVFVWGGYRAVATISDEVAERTWDWQRMSALGPWRIVWGKLFGGNAIVWIVAVISLVIMIYADYRYHPMTAALNESLTKAAILLGTGVLLHGFAMAIALSAHRNMATSRRVAATLPKLGVLVIAVLLAFFFATRGGSYFDGKSPVEWYFWSLPPDRFSLMTIWLYALWALISVYRLMRAEMQHRTIAWGWFAFTIFLTVYSIGLIGDAKAQREIPNPQLTIAFYIAVTMLYLALFAQPNNTVGYRALLENWNRGRAGLHVVPSWLPILALLICLAVAMSFSDAGALEHSARPGDEFAAFVGKMRAFSPIWLWAALLFVLRDIALLLFLNFNAKARRPNSAAFLYLLLAYLPLNWLLQLSEVTPLRGILMPFDTGHWITTLSPPLIQAIVMLYLSVRRWRRLASAIAPSPTVSEAAQGRR